MPTQMSGMNLFLIHQFMDRDFGKCKVYQHPQSGFIITVIDNAANDDVRVIGTRIWPNILGEPPVKAHMEQIIPHAKLVNVTDDIRQLYIIDTIRTIMTKLSLRGI